MGEVYRAADTKLNRDVALKVLPEAFAADPERLARFQREAQVLASLNHPNIAHVYGLEESDGTKALVMELVEGPTLADRIAKGPIPVDEALTIARQVAEGLEAAHDRGIVHRDLKPANIKVTPDGRVKVLDFGLAKMAISEASVNLTAAPTVTVGGTRDGLIVGTAAYMSPEQARGQPVDKRTDIWAFGCVLYEMLTGQRTFHGETLSDSIAAILEREPEWTAMPPTTAAGIRRLLRRCLDKDPRRRLHDIADARLELEDELTTSPNADSTHSAAPRPFSWTHGLVLLLALVAGVGLSFQMLRSVGRRAQPPGGAVAAFVETLPAEHALAPAPALAISRDGRRVAYVAVRSGRRLLYLRDLDQPIARAVPGTEGADEPFFSPDGQWVAFFAEEKLKKISVVGGLPVILADAPTPRGGAWGPDNSIIYAPTPASVLLRVSASGDGAPSPFTTLDRTMNEASHRWPNIVPDGSVVLFGAGPTVSVAGWVEAHVVAQSLKTGVRRLVAPHGTYPHYSELGRRLLYLQDRAIFSQAFNPATLEASGEAVPVLDQLALGALNAGSAQFDFSSTGSVVYMPGAANVPGSLLFVDRQGGEQVLPFPAAFYSSPRVSPDGRSVAVTVRGGSDSDLWLLDVERLTSTRLTFGGRNQWPVWAPDGKRIAFASSRNGSTQAYLTKIGGGSEEQLTHAPNTIIPLSWSSGGTLALSGQGDQNRTSIWMMTVDKQREPVPFHNGRGLEGEAVFSPDSHWVAYRSNESGRNEIYVRPYLDIASEAAVQISTTGGEEPVWARSGEELFFRHDDEMMVVHRALKNAEAWSLPSHLFVGNYAQAGIMAAYDVMPDGKRFLMVKYPVAARDASRFHIALNWLDQENIHK
jgi:Tol biopolymer transport system component